jgi:hypothetical protein
MKHALTHYRESWLDLGCVWLNVQRGMEWGGHVFYIVYRKRGRLIPSLFVHSTKRTLMSYVSHQNLINFRWLRYDRQNVNTYFQRRPGFEN